MNKEPLILHIDLGNQSISEWIAENKYVIYSELIRYAEKLIENDLENVQALMVSNLSDNIVFILKKDDVSILFEKAMAYFMSIEEYEQCAKIDSEDNDVIDEIYDSLSEIEDLIYEEESDIFQDDEDSF